MESAEVLQQQINERGGEEEAVEPIKHTSVAGNQGRRIFHPGISLEHGFDKISRLTEHADDDSHSKRQPQT